MCVLLPHSLRHRFAKFSFASHEGSNLIILYLFTSEYLQSKSSRKASKKTQWLIGNSPSRPTVSLQLS